MPSLPKPRLRRSARARADSAHLAAPTEPNVEVVEHDGLRWLNIERPRPIDRAWLEEHFDFHPLDYEDVLSRNQRPKIDEYDDYLFIVLYFPVFDKTVGRLNAAELDIFIGPDYLITLPNTPVPPVEYLFERCRSNEDVREPLFSKGSGYLLYKIVDDSFDYCFPMLRKIGNKLERLEEDIFEGTLRGGRARHLELEAGDHQLPQDHPPAARRPARPRAHEAALPRRGPRGLLRRHRRRVRAHLGHARELQGGRGGARGHERVGALAPGQRGAARADGVQRRRAAADPDREHLGHERATFPSTPESAPFWTIVVAMFALLFGMVGYFRARGWL